MRALVIAVALVGGSAAAVSAAPPATVVAPSPHVGSAPSSATGGHTALGFRRADFRSPATLRAARMRVLAQHLQAAHRVGLAAAQQPVYAGGDEDMALPDVDGDGVGDVLSSRLFARTPTLKVLSGRTGRVLWSVSSPGTLFAAYVPAPGGKSVMLLMSDGETGQETPAGGGAEDVFTVAAVNPKTGAAVWSSSIIGVIEDDPTGLLVAGAGEFDGVLMRKGTTPYLLLDRFTIDFGIATVATSVTPEVIDATNGNVVRPGAPLGGDEFTFATTVGDLDGDGVDDYIVCAGGDVPSVSAQSGATGQPLWTTHGSSYAFLVSLVTSPDLSGDHHDDLLLGWYDNGNTATVHAVNGATGSDVWTAPGDYGVPIGDIDRDGRSDTRVSVYGLRITFSAMAGTGRRLWSRDVLSPSGTHGLVWEAGDLDGDRLGDTYVEFVPSKSEAVAKTAAIVNGHTGASRGLSDIGMPLGVSLRGGAPSFVRGVTAKRGFALTAYDGRSHHALWRTVVKSSDVQQVSMLDVVSLGHGRVGLLALLSGRFTETVVLLDGHRGTSLWKSVYDTPGEEQLMFV